MVYCRAKGTWRSATKAKTGDWVVWLLENIPLL